MPRGGKGKFIASAASEGMMHPRGEGRGSAASRAERESFAYQRSRHR